jgi:hypothetical protein
MVFSEMEELRTNKTISNDKEYDTMWTKAICNEKYCQDYKIKCKNSKLVSKTPITGAIMTIDQNWEDPRTKEMQDLVC